MAPRKKIERTKGEKGGGSVYQRKSDGRWCATVTLSSSLGGDRRRKTVTAKTESEAEAKLAELLAQQAANNGDIPKAINFGQWANTWYTTIAVKKVRPKTAATYRSYLERYIVPVIGKVQLSQLTSAHIRRVHAYMEELVLSPTSIVQAHRIIAVCLKYAQQDGLVTRNVASKEAMDAPVKAVASLVALTAADGVKVLQAVADDRLASRWAAALLTGARQGELLGLELDRVTNELDLSWQLQRLSWEHGCRSECGRKRATDCPARKITAPPNWENRYLTGGLWLSRPKSKSGNRIIPLVDPLRSIIERRIFEAQEEPNPHGLLWTSDPKQSKGGGSIRETLGLDGSPIDPSWDSRTWHEVLRRAGVPDARLHDARHTTASLLLKAGVAEPLIMKILGHSSYVVTRGYQDVDREQLSGALTKLSALLL
jgi:integrase